MEEKSLNLLSIGEASEYLGVSIDTLRRWEKKGKIASYRSPGGHRYFKKDELDGMFGKKYERAAETKPRKEYETHPSESDQIENSPVEIIENTQDEQVQEVVDAIISETQTVKNEIESFFERQPKNIDIPRIDPIRIKHETEPTVQQAGFQSSPVPQQKLFTSFSQIPDRSMAVSKPTIKLNIQYFLVIASVVLIVAIAFAVIYYITQPQIISPI